MQSSTNHLNRSPPVNGERPLLGDVTKDPPVTKFVTELLAFSLPSFSIVKIERVQNEKLWFFCRTAVVLKFTHVVSFQFCRETFSFFKKKMDSDNGDRPAPGPQSEGNFHWLFHGTRNTKPEEIYAGIDGFHLKFSEESGLWGRGATALFPTHHVFYDRL